MYIDSCSETVIECWNQFGEKSYQSDVILKENDRLYWSKYTRPCSCTDVFLWWMILRWIDDIFFFLPAVPSLNLHRTCEKYSLSFQTARPIPSFVQSITVVLYFNNTTIRERACRNVKKKTLPSYRNRGYGKYRNTKRVWKSIFIPYFFFFLLVL